jgi:hypothetical protein
VAIAAFLALLLVAGVAAAAQQGWLPTQAPAEAGAAPADGVPSAGPAPTAIEPRRVVFIGDSITASSAEELRRGGYLRRVPVTVEARNGLLTRQQFETARAVAETRPAVVVINLGTNDTACMLANIASPDGCAHPVRDARDIIGDLRTIAGFFDPSVTCVVGVHPTFGQEPGDAWRAMEAEGIAAGVVDWGPESRKRNDELLADMLGHLTERGRTVYAEYVWEAVDQTCG